jgi:hypothetical protein
MAIHDQVPPWCYWSTLYSFHRRLFVPASKLVGELSVTITLFIAVCSVRMCNRQYSKICKSILFLCFLPILFLLLFSTTFRDEYYTPISIIRKLSLNLEDHITSKYFGLNSDAGPLTLVESAWIRGSTPEHGSWRTLSPGEVKDQVGFIVDLMLACNSTHHPLVLGLRHSLNNSDHCWGPRKSDLPEHKCSFSATVCQASTLSQVCVTKNV